MRVFSKFLVAQLTPRPTRIPLHLSLASQSFNKLVFCFSTIITNSSYARKNLNNEVFFDEVDTENVSNESDDIILTNYIQCTKTLKILDKKGIKHFFPIQI